MEIHIHTEESRALAGAQTEREREIGLDGPIARNRGGDCGEARQQRERESDIPAATLAV